MDVEAARRLKAIREKAMRDTTVRAEKSEGMQAQAAEAREKLLANQLALRELRATASRFAERLSQGQITVEQAQRELAELAKKGIDVNAVQAEIGESVLQTIATREAAGKGLTPYLNDARRRIKNAEVRINQYDKAIHIADKIAEANRRIAELEARGGVSQEARNAVLESAMSKEEMLLYGTILKSEALKAFLIDLVEEREEREQ
ncbi:MAG: hypothetical protein J4432_04170 [DPANN group archaeon]|nr:hypothetical protein [DPANN group archaeon]